VTSFYDLLKHDAAFKRFVDAQKGQDSVALAALKVEYDHRGDLLDTLKAANDTLTVENKQLRAALEKKRGRSRE
jgi:hypothetical protein